MSGCTQIDTVGVGNEQSGSRACGGGGTRAVALKLTWWKWQTSSRARIDTVGVGDERSGSRAHCYTKATTADWRFSEGGTHEEMLCPQDQEGEL